MKVPRAIAAAVLLLPPLLLAGCTPAGHWTKPGADEEDVAAAHQECQAAADIAMGPEAGIDEDILATRQTDWQRSQIGGLAAGGLGQETHDRIDKIAAACMRAKGFVLTK